jgi:hypothetical protein
MRKGEEIYAEESLETIYPSRVEQMYQIEACKGLTP